MKRYGRVYFCYYKELANSAKIKPTRKIPIHGTVPLFAFCSLGKQCMGQLMMKAKEFDNYYKYVIQFSNLNLSVSVMLALGHSKV